MNLPPDIPERLKAIVNNPSRVAHVERLRLDKVSEDDDLTQIALTAAELSGLETAFVAAYSQAPHVMASHRGGSVPPPLDAALMAHVLSASAGETVVATILPRGGAQPEPAVFTGTVILSGGHRIGVLGGFGPTVPTPAQRGGLSRMAGLAGRMIALKEGERRAAISTAALAREEKRHALALSAASIASWVWDFRTGTIECDELMPKLFDLPVETRFPASRIVKAIDPRDLAGMQQDLRAALASGDEYAGEYRIRAIDPPRWLASRGRVVERSVTGRPALVFGVSYDISEAKLGEERQRLLLRELNHRVKNTLATVQALATQTVRHASKPEDFLKAFSGRLHALGLAHNLLSDYEWRGIWLRELIDLQVSPLIESERERIEIVGPDVHVSPDQAVALGLILHELAENAVVHGALSVPEGRVELAWRVEIRSGIRMLDLDWVESGGPEVAPPASRGFGSILIERSLGKVLSSRVDHRFERRGVTARISMPASGNGGMAS